MASSRSNRPAGARLVSPAVRAPRHLARATPPSTGPGAASAAAAKINSIEVALAFSCARLPIVSDYFLGFLSVAIIFVSGLSVDMAK